MTITAKVIADSISAQGKRITTLQLCYPRFIHAEFMTHRVFSRNASSSRAIPVAKMIEAIRNDPAMPIHWGKNQPGMQAREELDPESRAYIKDCWINAAHEACDRAARMTEMGAHKQIVNRILEPFQHIHVVVTATEFDNFFELRAHPDAQPEIQALAIAMQDAMAASAPKLLQPGEWHLPYVTEDDWIDVATVSDSNEEMLEMARKISAARCCRVSYLKHDGTNSTIKEDLELCEKLVGAKPLHASPFEHQATPDDMKYGLVYRSPHLYGNFDCWIQYRKMIENQFQ